MALYAVNSVRCVLREEFLTRKRRNSYSVSVSCINWTQLKAIEKAKSIQPLNIRVKKRRVDSPPAALSAKFPRS